MKRIYIIMVVFLLPFFAIAQNENGAFGGGNGIFVFLNDNLYSTDNPHEGTTKIKIERQQLNGRWVEVAVVSSPKNEKEFSVRLKEAQQKMPYNVDILNDKADEIWQDLENWSNKSDTGTNLMYLAVQMAAGWLYLDKSAEQNVQYVYQISYLDDNNRQIKQITFNATSFPHPLETQAFQFLTSKSDGNGLLLEWMTKGDKLPSVFQALRKEKLVGEYLKIEAEYAIENTNEGSKVVVLDKSPQANHLYQYKLVAMDQFGNQGRANESPLIGHYNFRLDAPVITNFKAVNASQTLGTTLQWQFENYELAAAVQVYRSKDYDGEYNLIATLPRNANSYIDQSVDPMDKYYYYLQVQGPLGETGPKSIRLFSIYEDEQLPTPPSIFLDKVTNGAIHLTIANNDNNCKGIRVYRSRTIESGWEVISDLLEWEGDSIFYTDDKLIEKKASTFYYTAVNVSSSHVNSEYAEPINVFWHGLLNDQLDDGPRNISFKDNGNSITLYWDQSANDELSYIVMRSKMGEEKFKVLTSEAITINNYQDTTIETYQNYEYRIQPIGLDGNERKMSDLVKVERQLSTLLPPNNVRALSTKSGILISWNAVERSNIEAYQIYRYERGQSAIKMATIKSEELTEYLDEKTQKNKLYFYYITIIGKDGVESKPSIETEGRYF